MTEIKNTSMAKEDTIKISDTIGKKVIDNRGTEIGKVASVHLDPNSLSIEGISISNGLFREKDYVGKEYICSLSDEAAVLCQTPLTEYVGMKVYDSKGEKIGSVRDVNRTRETNKAYSLTIKRGRGKQDLIVTDNFIKNVGENIVLNDKVDID